MKYVAVIGTRNPTTKQEHLCKLWVQTLLGKGFGIVTGGCKGIDQIAMNEANKIDPRKVFVILPWYSYERQAIHKHNKVLVYNPRKHKGWYDSVFKYHPNASNLGPGGIKLHARNYGIVVNSVAVLAFPSSKPGGGGTGQGIRIAKALGKRLKVITSE